jgi:hypothetical protein
LKKCRHKYHVGNLPSWENKGGCKHFVSSSNGTLAFIAIEEEELLKVQLVA